MEPGAKHRRMWEDFCHTIKPPSSHSLSQPSGDRARPGRSEPRSRGSQQRSPSPTVWRIPIRPSDFRLLASLRLWTLDLGPTQKSHPIKVSPPKKSNLLQPYQSVSHLIQVNQGIPPPNEFGTNQPALTMSETSSENGLFALVEANDKKSGHR